MTAIESSRILGVYTVPIGSHADARGHFSEGFRREWIPGAREMVQMNISFSKKYVLRGLHYHLKQADFWTVPSGLMLALLYDLRRSSPTRGHHEAIEMGERWSRGLYVPAGVAHGFFTVVDTQVVYLTDEYYDGSDEHGVHWSDPAFTGMIPRMAKIVSERDAANPKLADIPPELLPR